MLLEAPVTLWQLHRVYGTDELLSSIFAALCISARCPQSLLCEDMRSTLQCCTPVAPRWMPAVSFTRIVSEHVVPPLCSATCFTRAWPQTTFFSSHLRISCGRRVTAPPDAQRCHAPLHKLRSSSGREGIAPLRAQLGDSTPRKCRSSSGPGGHIPPAPPSSPLRHTMPAPTPSPRHVGHH